MFSARKTLQRPVPRAGPCSATTLLARFASRRVTIMVIATSLNPGRLIQRHVIRLISLSMSIDSL